jgi:hypothetical protein
MVQKRWRIFTTGIVTVIGENDDLAALQGKRMNKLLLAHKRLPFRSRGWNLGIRGALPDRRGWRWWNLSLFA